MAKKEECDYTKWLTDQLELIGAYVVPIVGGMRQRRGLPDRWLTLPYKAEWQWSGWVEFKVPPNTLDALQAERIQQMNRRRYGQALVCWIYPERPQWALSIPAIGCIDERVAWFDITTQPHYNFLDAVRGIVGC